MSWTAPTLGRSCLPGHAKGFTCLLIERSESPVLFESRGNRPSHNGVTKAAPFKESEETSMQDLTGVELRVLTPDDWRLWRSLRLEALREAPFAFGSTLADWEGPRDTENDWRQRLLQIPYNVVAFRRGSPAGMVSGAVHGDKTAELLSMWVAPVSRGRRVGDALVESVREWAAAVAAHQLMLSVRADNMAAIALYRRHGFQDAGKSPDETPDGPAERLMVLTLVPTPWP